MSFQYIESCIVAATDTRKRTMLGLLPVYLKLRPGFESATAADALVLTQGLG